MGRNVILQPWQQLGLSAHNKFGTVSIRQVYHAVESKNAKKCMPKVRHKKAKSSSFLKKNYFL